VDKFGTCVTREYAVGGVSCASPMMELYLAKDVVLHGIGVFGRMIDGGVEERLANCTVIYSAAALCLCE